MIKVHSKVDETVSLQSPTAQVFHYKGTYKVESSCADSLTLLAAATGFRWLVHYPD